MGKKALLDDDDEEEDDDEDDDDNEYDALEIVIKHFFLTSFVH